MSDKDDKLVDLQAVRDQRHIEQTYRAGLEAGSQPSLDVRRKMMPSATDGAKAMLTLLHGDTASARLVAQWYREAAQACAELAKQDIYDETDKEYELACFRQWISIFTGRGATVQDALDMFRILPARKTLRGMGHHMRRCVKNAPDSMRDFVNEIPDSMQYQAEYSMGIADELERLVAEKCAL